jgi:hypothetical protein
MRRAVSIGLAAVLAIGVGYAVFGSTRHHDAGQGASSALTVVRGISGSEKEPFFRDQAVAAALARHGIKLELDYAGSRKIATLPNLGQYDFVFPSGVPAAEKIRRERKVVGRTEPFYTPMAIATFRPIADLLVRNKVARPFGTGYYQFDVAAYLRLTGRNARWSDLAGNTAYPTHKSLLVSSTDVRTSNSASQYLAIASYVANGDNVVQSRTQADAVLGKVAPLFLRQGFTVESSEEPFDDYLSLGIGKTPMVLVYEAQFLARQTAGDPALTSDMVLMYPTPTILSKHPALALTARGNTVATLLATDPELQQLAVKYGFRVSDAGALRRYLAARKVPEPPALVDVVEPPAYEVLEYLIAGIDRQIRGS